METNSILSANILDIIFDGKNKIYGAYDLRKTYGKRIGLALGITAIAILIFAVCLSWKNSNNVKSIIVPDIITEIATSDPKEEIITPKKLIKPEPIKSVQVTPPVIVIDKLVTEPPVENKDMIDARIDTKTIAVVIDNTISPPDEIKNSQVLELPATKKNTEDVIIEFVQIEARFKGDWGAYVKKEIEKNIDELTDAGVSGTCIVKFVVSKDGTVSNAEAITMKGTKLAEVAVNAIRKGPKWIPAQQNGTIVNAYRQQPVTFKINE